MSFMSVVPANKPEAVLYLAIDNPKNTAMLSSYTTTPIARRILLDIIDALDIKKQDGELEKELDTLIPVLLDLQGPKIRVGLLEEPIKIEKDQILKFRHQEKLENDIIPVDYEGIAKDVTVGSKILMDDGKISLEVVKVDNDIVYAKVIAGELLKQRKGINIPGSCGSINVLTERDKEFVKFAIDNKIDYLGLSFVRNAKDITDLKRRLGKIIVGYRKDNSPIFASDLKAEGSMAVLLKDAMMPNLVQTLEHTPAIIHGGPFANIAHGCNSVVATKIALKLSDYVITEAGFGADLGAEKFLDIKCRNLDIKPDAVVIVATIKALKYHGGIPKEDITNENIEGLDKGLHNLYCHIDNIKNKFGLNVIVALNKYSHDTDKEIKYLEDKLAQHDVSLSIVTSYTEGSAGAIDIANTLVELTNKPSTLNYIYDINESIESKIEKIATKVYHAKGVIYDDKATEQIKELVKLGYDKLPICIAKTQYSLSDNPSLLGRPENFDITVKEVRISNGAGFIVVLTGDIMTMPGLPKVPAANRMDILDDGEIVGLF